MDTTEVLYPLPKSTALNLCLTNPTPQELQAIYRLTYAEWGDALTLPQYLEESEFLTKVPLARKGGMLSWILTENDKSPNERPILCSCETFQKRTFVTSTHGGVSANIIYGIASVFVNPQYRSQGYGRRLMQELANATPDWHVGSLRSMGSIRYSDIGRSYYAKLGWLASEVNFHLEFDPMANDLISDALSLQENDLTPICRKDEALLWMSMASLPPGKTRFAIVPDSDHMQWHISKETFACKELFGEVPKAKGAISGEDGNKVWAIWVHRYYDHPRTDPHTNVLYILRFVVENQDPNSEQLKSQVKSVKAILQRAQQEAENWKLQCVKLWHPSSSLQDLVRWSGLLYRWVEREEESIASLRWLGGTSAGERDIDWLTCEKYAWM